MIIEQLAALATDFRLSIRSLARTPGFVLIAILTLGLGIGANTSSFSVLNEVLLRPLPYPESGRIDRIYRVTPQDRRGGVSPAEYLELKPETGGYGEIAGYAFSDTSLSAPGEPADMARGLRVSAEFFETLGIKPQLGRDFRRDEVEGNHRVILISHRAWQTRFAGEAGILGRVVRVDAEACEIIGVLPDSINDWRHLAPFDIYRPLAFTDNEKADRSASWVRLVGRRTVTPAQASGFVAAFGRRLAAEYPATDAGTSWRTLPINVAVAPDNGPVILGMLVGLSIFVMLIACSNLANLLLARTMARAREFAVRSALGASRGRLLLPLFAESLLLAFAGGVVAILVTLWTNDWLTKMGRATYDNGFLVVLDWHVLGWAVGACLFTATAFGVAPALFALRLDPNTTLKSGGRGATGDRGHRRFRNLLIIGQFALAMVLLSGAALFVRGVQEANHRNYGWDADHLVTGTTLLPAATYKGEREITEFQRLAVERLEAIPGVASASVSYAMPFFGLAETRKFLVAGRETPEPGREPVVVINGVSPRYFETVGTRLIDGRAFDGRDALDSPKVFIVNEAMARSLFPGESPIGRRLARADGKKLEWGEIVGVASDIQSIFMDQTPVAWQLYQPIAQEPRPAGEFAVRTAAGAPAALVASIRSAMAELDADLPIRDLQPAATTIAKASYSWQILGSMLSFLAAIGLTLASLGMYGVIARTMAQRTGEFGIRLALGALASDITRLVLASGAKLALAGTAFGLIGAFGISRLIGSLFPGMRMSGLPVLAGVTLFLMGIALLACYMPARTASRIDPIETLRAE